MPGHHDGSASTDPAPERPAEPRPDRALDEQVAALRLAVQEQAERTGRLLALLERERATSGHGTLLGRLQVNFSPLYLTLLGIIQGTALAALAAQLTGKAAALGPTVWLEAAGIFLTIIFVWHQWAVVTFSYYWHPTFADAAIPFLFGATELAMAAVLGPDATAWLEATTLAWLVGVVMFIYPYERAARQPRNARLLQAEGARWPRYVGVALCLLASGALAALAAAGVLDPTSWIGPAADLVVGAVFFAVHAVRWQRLLRRSAATEQAG